MDAKVFDHEGGRLIRSGDADLYVEERGDPAAPALVLLHGGFGSAEDFNPIAAALGSRFRLIGVDGRGHGRSTLGTEKLTYELMTRDLVRIIDALGLDAFDVLGFSDGGIVAYRYAARRETRLRRLATVGAGWELGVDDPSWKLISGMTAKRWKSMFPESHELYLRLNPEPDFDRFAQAVIGMWTDLGPDGYPGRLVGRIKAEILVARGDRDRLTTAGSLIRLQGLAKKASFFNLPFADHAAFADAPELFLRGLGMFFGVDLSFGP
jgi:pimeloyl-ACP methyl ester carboxylesterase